MKQRIRLALASIAIALSACGGSGSPTPTSTVAGTAATGAAIASGTVTLKCVSGTTTSATTGTDGSFSIDVTGVTLPCVGRVDYKDSTGTAQKLHTFISAAGTANITPVTDLLVANLTTGAAADAFDKFDAAKAKAFTAAQIKAAADAVKTYLKNTLGVDTSKLPDDPVGTKLKAAVGSTAGDDFDKVLDDLQAKLKSSGKKLSDVASDLSKGGGVTVAAGSAVGKGAYAKVTASDNSTFLSTVVAKCTKDATLSDKEHDVYKNCKQDTSDVKLNLVANMWFGGLPNSTGTVISGPGVGTSATVSSFTGITGVANGDGCKVAIVEPFIPLTNTLVKGTSNTQAGSGFSFKGTDQDTLYITPGGVVLQYNMTDGAGNVLSVQFETSTGQASASVGNYDAGKFIYCADSSGK